MGAPGTFQAVIEDMLQVLDAEDVMMAHLDDVICFHSSFEGHLKGLSGYCKPLESLDLSYQAGSVSLPQDGSSS